MHLRVGGHKDGREREGEGAEVSARGAWEMSLGAREQEPETWPTYAAWTVGIAVMSAVGVELAKWAVEALRERVKSKPR